MEDINLGFFAGIPSNCFYWGAAAPQYKQFERKGGIHNHPSGQGFQTVRLITSQKFPANNPRLISSILTFRDLHSHIFRIFMRMAGFPCRAVPCQNIPRWIFPFRAEKKCRAVPSVPCQIFRVVPCREHHCFCVLEPIPRLWGCPV